MAQHSGLWAKVDLDLLIADTQDESEVVEKPKKTWWRRSGRWAVADLIGLSLWTYMFVKLAVIDVDRWIVQRVSPGLVWLLDLRIVAVAIALAVVLLVFRKKRALWLFYVAIWPLVLIFFKVPRFFYRRQSWMLLIGTLNGLFGAFRGIRAFLVVSSLTAVSAITILRAASSVALISTSIVLGMCWTYVLARALITSFKPSMFIKRQMKMITKALDSAPLASTFEPEPALRDADVERFTKDQVSAIVQKASVGLLIYRTGHVWASQIDKYRRSAYSIAFSVASVVFLIVYAVIVFASLNLAAFKVSPTQYETSVEPGFLTFVYYSFASLFVSEVNVVTPQSGWALVLQVSAGLSVAVLVILVIASVVFGVKQSRNDADATAAIKVMHQKSDELAAKVAKSHEQPIDDLYQTIVGLGNLTSKWLLWLSEQIPEGSENPDTTA